MAAIRDVEVDAIEAGRRSLVELKLAHQTTARVARKQAVKDLFGTLLASWEAGVPFEAMAKALTSSGIQITTETLRSYFFELKTVEQLRTEHAQHERAMAKIRQENESQQRSKDLQHARELARAGTELLSNAREAKVAAAHQVATQAVEAARRGPVGAVLTVGTNELRASEQATSHAPAQPGDVLPASGQVEAFSDVVPNAGRDIVAPVTGGKAFADVEARTTGVVERVSMQPAVETVAAPGRKHSPAAKRQLDGSEAGQAKTLDEIARTSQGQPETGYSENLILKEGNTVWYESGKPFNGYLSPRTVHMLRNVGRVIAPTEGRTAKDFVPMSHEL